MKKRYIFGTIFMLIVVFFFASLLVESDNHNEALQNQLMPRFGERVWTYNMNKYQWREYNKRDMDDSKDEIILQVVFPEENSGRTSYKLLTGNVQVPKDNALFGESSDEFLIEKNLYSYFPKNFQYYQIIFNGVKFVPGLLSEKEVATLFPEYNIIKVSELEKGSILIDIDKKKNEYLILNDVGETFYKYYIVPNDSKKLKIGQFSNQFKILGKTNIKIQRLEGCSRVYPCYEIIAK